MSFGNMGGLQSPGYVVSQDLVVRILRCDADKGGRYVYDACSFVSGRGLLCSKDVSGRAAVTSRDFQPPTPTKCDHHICGDYGSHPAYHFNVTAWVVDRGVSGADGVGRTHVFSVFKAGHELLNLSAAQFLEKVPADQVEVLRAIGRGLWRVSVKPSSSMKFRTPCLISAYRIGTAEQGSTSNLGDRPAPLPAFIVFDDSTPEESLCRNFANGMTVNQLDDGEELFNTAKLLKQQCNAACESAGDLHRRNSARDVGMDIRAIYDECVCLAVRATDLLYKVHGKVCQSKRCRHIIE